MLNVAIICEYNPFHNGHKHQIDEIRNFFSEEVNIIAIMSGNFVQRGEFAIYDKFLRAKTAILGGCNVVFELPLPFSTSSAEYFANGAISLLNKLNNIDYLCFGSECGSIDMLLKISKILIQNNIDVKKYLNQGLSYKKSLINALLEINYEYAKILENPNNTLAIEYIKALILSNSKIKPLTILREKVGYHSDFEKDNFASASYIRQNISNNISHLMPYECYLQVKHAKKFDIHLAESQIFAFLLRKDENYFKNILDVTEGLEFKIVKALKISQNLDTLCSNIASKRYTKSKILRIILNSYLEITKDLTKSTPNFLKLLALDKKGATYLKTVTNIEIITKTAKFTPKTDYDNIIFNKTLVSSDLFYASNGSYIKNVEFLKSPIYIGK